MSIDEQWRKAIEDEARDPNEWRPDTQEFMAALAERFTRRGCPWPYVAARLVLTRSRTSLDRAEFAARLGLTESELRSLEGA